MKNIAYAIGFLVFFVNFVIFYHGGFTTPKVEKIKAGPYHVLYLTHTGSYRGVDDIRNKIAKNLKNFDVKHGDFFGIYYDKPGMVPESKLRSLGGVLVDEKQLKEAQPLIKDGLMKEMTIPEAEYIHTEFPFRNTLSMLFALRKVYPALDKYVKDNHMKEYVYKEKGYEDNYVLEIYHKRMTEYLMPSE